jgi:hypothetical protein
MTRHLPLKRERGLLPERSKRGEREEVVEVHDQGCKRMKNSGRKSVKKNAETLFYNHY